MRILLVTSLPPWPTYDGGRQRTNLLYRALSRCGHVDTALISRAPIRIGGEDMAVLRDRFGLVGCVEGTRIGQEYPWRMIEPLSTSMPDRLAHLLGGWQLDYRPGSAASRWMSEHLARQSYDLLVSRYLWPMAHVGLIGHRRVIVDVDDLESQRIQTLAATKARNPIRQHWWGRRIRQIAGVEQRLLALTDHAWLTKRQDGWAVQATQSSLLPNVPFIPDEVSQAQLLPANSSRRILFVGSLDYIINIRAIDRFIDQSWRQVRHACPDATLHIVGKGMAERDRTRWAAAPGVCPVGFVEDLRNAYEGAAFTVVPIWEGAGTKIKVLESLLFGRAVVATSHSLLGYEDHLFNEQSVLAATDDDALAHACIVLLNDPARRAAIAAVGHEQVSSHYSVRAFFDHVQTTVGRVFGGGV